MTALEGVLDPYPPKAAQLIVTIYGDVVEPRGGSLWTGDLIRLCGEFCISESLVRTAVSRLVARRQLTSEREGRRSFHSLTPEARSEFQGAAARFFETPPQSTGWAVAIPANSEERDQLLADGYAGLGSSALIGPARLPTGFSGVVIRGNLEGGEGYKPAFLADLFDLRNLSEAYAEFTHRFEGLAKMEAKDGDTALQLRLALIHAFREIRSRDPSLPLADLPSWWQGQRAKVLFARLYRKLSEQADVFIAENLRNRSGLLNHTTVSVQQRLDNLKSWDE